MAEPDVMTNSEKLDFIIEAGRILEEAVPPKALDESTGRMVHLMFPGDPEFRLPPSSVLRKDGALELPCGCIRTIDAEIQCCGGAECSHA